MATLANILAFESSCDDTAVAVVDAHGHVRLEARASQIALHQQYGGVVPEVASRAHFEVLDGLMLQLLQKSGKPLNEWNLQAVAATHAPGLIGPLLVGASYARGLASGLRLPLHGVHHLRGHVASVLLEAGEPLPQAAARLFPALVLLVSGGHTQILEVQCNLRAQKLADTADDAVGECFDKSAKLMGLPYPGGPQIEALAAQAQGPDLSEAREVLARLPRPKSSEGFSFSGLKTAVRLELEKNPALKATPRFCWALQECVLESLQRVLTKSMAKVSGQPRSFIVCGGVAANQRLCAGLEAWAQSQRLHFRAPSLKYSTDNAAMIAAAAWVQDPALALHSVEARAPL